MTSTGDASAATDAVAARHESETINDRGESLRDLYHRASACRGGGYLFTARVSDPISSWFAAVAMRCGIHPTVVTLTDLGLAVVASVVVVTQADQLQAGWIPGLVALVLWQLSYILDGADGQAARASGQTSSFGARVDVLVDFLVHALVISALLTVLTQRTDPPIVVIVFVGILWTLGILVYALTRNDGNENHSFTQRGGTVAVLKLVGDNGFIMLVLGLWLFVHPQSIIIPVVTISIAHACFLLASISREAYLSMRT